MKFQSTFLIPLQVKIEDLEVNGVVHHPIFLKYLECARYHSIKECGCSSKRCGC
jgi:acyl-CoA thioesterase FadM